MENINTKLVQKKMDFGFYCNNIVLIGFMGSGKTYIGSHLAQELHCFLLDCDTLIEQTYNSSITDIFKHYGEKHFRNLELKLQQWLIGNIKSSVIATGGGMPLLCHSLKNIGTVFFLDVDFEIIKQRLNAAQTAKRPLLSDINKAYTLYNYRKPIYIKAAHHIINANQTRDQIINEITTLSRSTP